MGRFITNEYINDNICVIKIERTSKANALNEELVGELFSALLDISQSKELSAIIITGTENFFSAGVDVSELATSSYESSVLGNFMDFKWTFLEKIKLPVIAAINGFAFGGGFELALMCDMIVANSGAKFGFPEVNLGLMPGLGGTVKLFQLIGSQKAFEIIATADTISADDAHKLGLVNYVCNDPLTKAKEIAMKLSKKPKTSILAIKKIFASLRRASAKEQELERQLFQSLLSTSEKNRLVGDFLHK